ncbi:MAG: dTDP-4-dehydrorhamnose 3,5-epimerase family protein [Acidimicrobiia bacterium]
MAKVEKSTEINDVLIITPDVFGDERGMFVETFRQEWLPENAPTMVQGNRATRKKGSLVGLHYHLFQEDFWYVPFGTALVALHDLREGSPTNGKSQTLEISGEDHRGVYIPRGVAHGFLALTDMTITYLVDNYYNGSDELGVLYSDPELGFDWPLQDLTVSNRDKENPKRSEIKDEIRPQYKALYDVAPSE